MKKYFLIAIMALSVITVSAQTTGRWGVKAGVNLSNFGKDADLDSRVGFHIGGLYEYTVSDLLSIQPEALLTLKGAKDITAYYIEVPINAKFNFAVGSDKVYLTVGPYLAYGVAGKYDAIGDPDFFQDGYNKRFDFGAGIGAGYELQNGLFFNLGYSFGLLDISDNVISSNNLNAAISIGYKF